MTKTQRFATIPVLISISDKQVHRYVHGAIMPYYPPLVKTCTKNTLQDRHATIKQFRYSQKKRILGPGTSCDLTTYH